MLSRAVEEVRLETSLRVSMRAAHQVVERESASELDVDGGSNFFKAGAAAFARGYGVPGKNGSRR